VILNLQVQPFLNSVHCLNPSVLRRLEDLSV
jgi:hypothetical protein